MKNTLKNNNYYIPKHKPIREHLNACLFFSVCLLKNIFFKNDFYEK